MSARSKVRGKSAAFIEKVAADAELRQVYEPLPEQSKGRILDSFLFGILTATERTSAAERSLAALKTANYPTDIERVRGILYRSGIVYKNVKAQYVVEFISRYLADPWAFEPKADETCSAYRDRMLKAHVRGLAFCKTS